MAGSSANKPAGSGSGNKELREEMASLKSDLAELSQTVRKQTQHGVKKAQADAADKLGDIETRIHEKPVQSAALALGVGFVLGTMFTR